MPCALPITLLHGLHVDAVVSGGAVAALTRVKQFGSQRAKDEAANALSNIPEAD